MKIEKTSLMLEPNKGQCAISTYQKRVTPSYSDVAETSINKQ